MTPLDLRPHAPLVADRNRAEFTDEGFRTPPNPCQELIQYHCHMDLDQQKSYLNLLTFPQTDARLQNIEKAHEDTCLWLLEKPEYQNWLSPEQSNLHGGFLWIKGKPGAGKSTMMKYIFMHTKEKVKDAIVLSFFFNARGGAFEKSTLGMYRSLLFQLLTALPVDLRILYFDEVSAKQQLSETFQWDHRELQMILSSTIQRLQDYQLFLFIDAIDECEERHARDMISFLERLGRSAVSSGLDFKICLASRHYPHISIDRGIELIMEDQEGHETDIRKYVNSKLKAGRSRKIEEIKAEICQRAAGVFLWVVLVVRMLNEAFDHGRVQAVRQRLNEIPDELDDLFTDILTRDNKDKEDLVLCLQWILFAQRPLTREELYFAIWFHKSSLLQRDEEHTQQVIEQFILSASKGLAEITRSKDHTVQFIHESVRDFFLLRDGWTRFQPSLKENPAGLSHDGLRRCCFRYLQRLNENYRQVLNILAVHAERERKESVKAKIPFMEYAIQGLLFHADSAESRGISQKHFLNALSDQFADFITANNAMERFVVRCHRKGVRLLYVLSEKGFGHLIQLHLEMGADVSTATGRFGYPMDVAVYNGNITAIRALLRCELRRTPSPDEDEFLEPELVTRMKQYLVQMSRRKRTTAQTLITYAFQRKHRIIFKVLVEAAEIDLNFRLNDGHTLLTWAIAHNHEDLAKDLLNTGKVDVNFRYRKDDFAFKMAIHRGRKQIVEMLLGDDSLDHNYQDEHGRNAVLWAAACGDKDILQLLLQFRTLNVGHRDHQERDALSVAAESGKPTMVQMLLGTGVFDVDHRDNAGRTPLSWAAGRRQNSNTDGASVLVIALLLRTDSVDVNSKDKQLRTPLSWAVHVANQAAVELLLNIPTVDVDCKDIAGQTPFSIASIVGCKDILKLLLRTGKVNINSQDILGRTPLSWAAGPWLPDERGSSFVYNSTDRECVMKIILSTGVADVDRKDVFGRKPAWWALTSDYITFKHPRDRNSAAIVKLLKDHVPSQDESKIAEMQRLLERTETELVEDILATSMSYQPVDGLRGHFRSLYDCRSGRIGTDGWHSRGRYSA
jgi:ankyrin repeat protein